MSSEPSSDGGTRGGWRRVRHAGVIRGPGDLAESPLSSLSEPATRPSSEPRRALALSLWAERASSEQLRRQATACHPPGN